MDSSQCGHHNIDGGGGGGAAPVRPRRLRRLRTGRLMAAATVDSSAGVSAATQGAWVCGGEERSGQLCEVVFA